jgi:hypothetical protein
MASSKCCPTQQMSVRQVSPIPSSVIMASSLLVELNEDHHARTDGVRAHNLLPSVCLIKGGSKGSVGSTQPSKAAAHGRSCKLRIY